MILKLLLLAYLVLHILVCLVIYVGQERGIFKFSEQLFPVIALIPVWGLISAFLADYDSRNNKTGSRPLTLEDMRLALGDARFMRFEMEDETAVIPLEEALLINDPEMRRKLMLNILHQNPKEYIQLLHAARQDNDIEVTHYASTAIMEIQREFELQLQKSEREYRKEPDNIDHLDNYINSLRRYIDSGLIDESILFIHRQRFARILEEKMAVDPEDLEARLYAVRNYLELGNFNKVYTISERLVKKWPADERAWFAKLEVCQRTNDGEALQKTIQEIRKRNIYLTPEGRGRLDYWENRR